MSILSRAFSIGIIAFAVISLGGCSVANKIGKSAKNLTTFGKDKQSMAVDDSLIIPPSLKVPANVSSSNAPVSTAKTQTGATASKAVYRSSKNYYIVVGTYPDQVDALDTFVRLSSIGLKGATMESRQTKTGQKLHMVRLGPYNKQEDIDEANISFS